MRLQAPGRKSSEPHTPLPGALGLITPLHASYHGVSWCSALIICDTGSSVVMRRGAAPSCGSRGHAAEVCVVAGP